MHSTHACAQTLSARTHSEHTHTLHPQTQLSPTEPQHTPRPRLRPPKTSTEHTRAWGLQHHVRSASPRPHPPSPPPHQSSPRLRVCLPALLRPSTPPHSCTLRPRPPSTLDAGSTREGGVWMGGDGGQTVSLVGTLELALLLRTSPLRVTGC
eukprot:1307695-Rhodomonas_salina.1